MATGSGKTYTAVNFIYRLISRAKARRVLFLELYPERRDGVVPKTLIFAKDDNHAENIVRLVREEFGKGNDFCQKITYRARRKPEDILQDFRNSYHPRIAVTVDMIATRTDVRAIEISLFMRQVRSRGTRIISSDELQAVTAVRLAQYPPPAKNLGVVAAVIVLLLIIWGIWCIVWRNGEALRLLMVPII